MGSEITIVATQYRRREWAAQVWGCQNRLTDMSVVDWCANNGLTKANYFYLFRRVRATCLESIPKEMRTQQVVPVDLKLL